jgi:signal transduction histidine kinase
VRRRLVLLSLATTVLVVVAFVLPLGLLVRRQAIESAKVAAERDAQSVAAVVALALATNDDPNSVASTLGGLPEGTIVFLGDTVIGEERPGQGSLAETAAAGSATLADEVAGGWEIALPVVASSQVAVVDSFVTSAELTAGVSTAWLLLGSLALVLIAVAVWVADRLGRSLTSPIEDLARSAHRLAEGDLETRVEPSDPEEIRETGEAFNYLAHRLDQLLVEERESAADLSHRLRTPLTSLRLQAEALDDEEERKAIVGQVDRLEHAMNQVIELARSRAAKDPGQSDINQVVTGRVSFWRVLADEQGREMRLDLADFDGNLGIGEDDLGVVLDTLVGNVFAHTPPGTGFEVRTFATSSGAPCLEVADSGPGFGGRNLVERGVSGAGSTGLGLDIVRKTASALGGTVELDDRPGGGAVVRVVFG